MKLNNEEIKKLIGDVAQLNEISLSDIPSIDLYMDQVTTFFENKLGHLKRDEKDPILTKTMINNYTKGKILMPPYKKKYSKEHIVLLILIYNLKQVLSMADIHSLFSPIIDEKNDLDRKLDRNLDSNISIEEIYSAFIEIKENELENFSNEIDERINVIKEKTLNMDSEKHDLVELLLIVMMLINQATVQKRLAEQIIDQFFNKGNDEKKEKKK